MTNVLTPVEQIDELSAIVRHVQTHWTPGVSQDWTSYMLQKLEIRLQRLRELQLGYEYQPDAKKLIEHAMVALEDQFGEKAEWLNNYLREIFFAIRQAEAGDLNALPPDGFWKLPEGLGLS